MLHLQVSGAQHKDWTCPEGGADPQKDKHWEEYRARRKQAEEAGKIGKGKSGPASKGTGKAISSLKGKSKGKNKGQKGENDTNKNTTDANAKACVDLE